MAVLVRRLELRIPTSEVGGSNLRGGDAAKFCSEFGISQFGTIYEGEEETFATKVLLLDCAHLGITNLPKSLKKVLQVAIVSNHKM